MARKRLKSFCTRIIAVWRRLRYLESFETAIRCFLLWLLFFRFVNQVVLNAHLEIRTIRTAQARSQDLEKGGAILKE